MSFLPDNINLKNVEIKAKLYRAPATLRILQDITSTDGIVSCQKDITFAVNEGVLKLRRFEDTRQEPNGELIYYLREEDVGPKLCHYKKIELPTKTLDSLLHMLSAALTVQGVVVKKRITFVIQDSTRVNVDEVSGLGLYIEIQTNLDGDRTFNEGKLIVNHIAKHLKVCPSDFVAGTYDELLEKRAREKSEIGPTKWDTDNIQIENDDFWTPIEILANKENQKPPKLDLAFGRVESMLTDLYVTNDNFRLVEPSWSSLILNRSPERAVSRGRTSAEPIINSCMNYRDTLIE